ncbi:MAG TPA: FkbM family methyltransferase [Gaiellaceae bacterium]|nr:FkbM family methyltransferase [Gaiellaceae bacterium]
MIVDPWLGGLRIALPRTGTAARVYYEGSSNVPLADEIRRHLREGGTYVDVGAHIGEFALLAAQAVGTSGIVLALEPNHDLALVLEENVRLNRLSNVAVRAVAVGAESGRTGFRVDERSGGGWIDPGQGTTYRVDCVTLDELAEEEALPQIDFLKIDAAGGEVAVLQGARRLLSEERLAYVASKVYHPDVVRARRGGNVRTLASMLLDYGYSLEALLEGCRSTITRPEELAELSSRAYSIVLVASK